MSMQLNQFKPTIYNVAPTYLVKPGDDRSPRAEFDIAKSNLKIMYNTLRAEHKIEKKSWKIRNELDLSDDAVESFCKKRKLQLERYKIAIGQLEKIGNSVEANKIARKNLEPYRQVVHATLANAGVPDNSDRFGKLPEISQRAVGSLLQSGTLDDSKKFADLLKSQVVKAQRKLSIMKFFSFIIPGAEKKITAVQKKVTTISDQINKYNEQVKGLDEKIAAYHSNHGGNEESTEINLRPWSKELAEAYKAVHHFHEEAIGILRAAGIDIDQIALKYNPQVFKDFWADSKMKTVENQPPAKKPGVTALPNTIPESSNKSLDNTPVAFTDVDVTDSDMDMDDTDSEFETDIDEWIGSIVVDTTDAAAQVENESTNSLNNKQKAAETGSENHFR
jgi:hypothetical protein